MSEVEDNKTGTFAARVSYSSSFCEYTEAPRYQADLSNPRKAKSFSEVVLRMIENGVKPREIRKSRLVSDSVPQQAFICENCKAILLESAPVEWAKEIASVEVGFRYSESEKEVVKAGFKIASMVAKLEEIYAELCAANIRVSCR